MLICTLLGASGFPLFRYVIDFGIRVARALLKRVFDGFDGTASGVQQPSPHFLSLTFSSSPVFSAFGRVGCPLRWTPLSIIWPR